MESVIYKAQNNRKAIPIGKALMLLSLIICLEIGSTFIYHIFIGKARISPLFITAIQRIAVIIVLLGFIFKWGYCFDHLGLSTTKFKQGIIHGLFWCIGFGMLVGLFGGILWIFGVNPRSLIGHTKAWTPIGLVAYILVGCLLGPIVEDLVFTGLIYNGLRAKLNIAFSVLLVSIFFALAHGFISMSLIIQFIGGVLFTLSFEFSGSLLTPMIIHWCGNIAILTIQIL